MSTPTKAAMAAATEIDITMGAWSTKELEMCATIIDRETHLPELLNAIRLAREVLASWSGLDVCNCDSCDTGKCIYCEAVAALESVGKLEDT